MEIQQTTFDYGTLAIETREFLQEAEVETNYDIQNMGVSAMRIGKRFLTVKERLPHGMFQKWVEAKFPLTMRTAQRMMNAAEKFKNDNLSLLNISDSVIYLLSAPSTPETARQEAIQKAEAGETVTHKEAQELVKAHKAIAEKEAQVSMLESTIRSLQEMLPTEDILSKISTLESQLAEARNKPIRDPQLEQDLLTAQTRARALEESLIEAQNKPAQLVEKIVKVKDEEALAKLQREKKTYQDKANAMTHELANYERRIKELESQIEVDNPHNIDISTAKEITSHMRRIEFDIRLAVTDAIKIGGYLEETKAALKAMIDSLTETHNLIESHKMIEIG